VLNSTLTPTRQKQDLLLLTMKLACFNDCLKSRIIEQLLLIKLNIDVTEL